MLGLIRINYNGDNIAKCKLSQDEYGNYGLISKKNIENIFIEEKQINSGFVDCIDIDLDKFNIKSKINTKIIDEIIKIEEDFAYNNAFYDIYRELNIVCDKFKFIKNKCDYFNFKYKINWVKIVNDAKFYKERLISEDDIISNNINNENLNQFNELSDYIKEELINHLKNKI